MLYNSKCDVCSKQGETNDIVPHLRVPGIVNLCPACERTINKKYCSLFSDLHDKRKQAFQDYLRTVRPSPPTLMQKLKHCLRIT